MRDPGSRSRSHFVREKAQTYKNESSSQDRICTHKTTCLMQYQGIYVHGQGQTLIQNDVSGHKLSTM